MSARESTKGVSNVQIALIALVLTVFGFYLAFAKSIPFTGGGYELQAVFSDAQSVRANSPVRVAGVEVGKVKGIEHLTDEDGEGVDAAVVTMELKDDALPIKEDATLQLRPRLFLEGNLFVDLRPGTPGGEELESGSVIPLEQTSVSVQLDQVLTSLQKPTRENLQIFLEEFGTALCGDQPSDAGCATGAGGNGLRESFRTSPDAYRYTAEVNEALLGTEPGDLVGVVRNLGTTVEALDRNREQLKDLVTNFRIVTGSFAAEDEALEQAIAELDPALAEGRPALAKLNGALPQLRAFSREILPGVRSANSALDDANPFIRQLRAAVAKPELRGLVKDLRPTIPSLARLASESRPFLEESRSLASCFSSVVIPWADTTVPAASENPADWNPVYKNTGYGLAGLAGESRAGDANGQYFRVLGGGGTNTISIPATDTGAVAGVTPFGLDGVQPAKASAAKTPFRPDVPCETQDPPNLNTGDPTASRPRQATVSSSAARSTPAGQAATTLSTEYAEIFTEFLKADALAAGGDLAKAAAVRREATENMRIYERDLLPQYQKAIKNLGEGG
ncbi:hypothetical protein BH20ACT15_BH20ACT15_01710 [soil metagenome]